MNTRSTARRRSRFTAEPALSRAHGDADALAAVKQLVLDAVTSPLTGVMYASAQLR